MQSCSFFQSINLHKIYPLTNVCTLYTNVKWFGLFIQKSDDHHLAECSLGPKGWQYEENAFILFSQFLRIFLPCKPCNKDKNCPDISYVGKKVLSKSRLFIFGHLNILKGLWVKQNITKRQKPWRQNFTDILPLIFSSMERPIFICFTYSDLSWFCNFFSHAKQACCFKILLTVQM